MYAAIVLPKLPEEPHQPVNFSFPERSFGQKKPVHCSLQGKWFNLLVSGIGFIMMMLKMQFSVSSVCMQIAVVLHT